ncbi:MAG: hypothetical protein ACPGTU_11750 [Myxococcota bacterium]
MESTWILLGLLCASGITSCQSAEDTASPFTSSGHSSNTSTASAEFIVSCQGYCGHVYTSASDCDETTLESEGNACYAFCNIQGQDLSNACEAALIAAYDCVVDNDVEYLCIDGQGSAVTEETTCTNAWLAADACLAQQ